MLRPARWSLTAGAVGIPALGIVLSSLVAAQASDATAMIAEVVRTGSVIVRGIEFENNEAAPTSASAAVLREVRAMLREHAEWSFEVQVHTDETGDAQRDLDLSTGRARAVVACLVADGIAAGRLVVSGQGSSRPLRASAGADPGLVHRRVELRKLNEE